MEYDLKTQLDRIEAYLYHNNKMLHGLLNAVDLEYSEEKQEFSELPETEETPKEAKFTEKE